MSPHLLPTLVAQVAAPAAARVIDEVVDVLDFKSFLGKSSENSGPSQPLSELSDSAESSGSNRSNANILSELKELAQQIRLRLSQIAALHNTSEFSIRSDESGGFHVDTESSHRAAIEHELSSDPEFGSAFKAVFQGLSQVSPEVASLFVGDLHIENPDHRSGVQELHKFALAFKDGGLSARFDR